jgi:hypothetical protein
MVVVVIASLCGAPPAYAAAAARAPPRRPGGNRSQSAFPPLVHQRPDYAPHSVPPLYQAALRPGLALPRRAFEQGGRTAWRVVGSPPRPPGYLPHTSGSPQLLSMNTTTAVGAATYLLLLFTTSAFAAPAVPHQPPPEPAGGGEAPWSNMGTKAYNLPESSFALLHRKVTNHIRDAVSLHLAKNNTLQKATATDPPATGDSGADHAAPSSDDGVLPAATPPPLRPPPAAAMIYI